MFGRKLAPPVSIRALSHEGNKLIVQHASGTPVTMYREHLKDSDIADLKARMHSDGHALLEAFSKGGEVKPVVTVMHESPEVLMVQDAAGEPIPIVKSAHSEEELDAVRQMAGGVAEEQPPDGDVQYLAEGGEVDLGYTPMPPFTAGEPSSYDVPPAGMSSQPPPVENQSRALSGFEEQQAAYQSYLSHVSPGITPLSPEQFGALQATSDQRMADARNAAYADRFGLAASLEQQGMASSGAPVGADVPPPPGMGPPAPSQQELINNAWATEARLASTIPAPKPNPARYGGGDGFKMPDIAGINQGIHTKTQRVGETETALGASRAEGFNAEADLRAKQEAQNAVRLAAFDGVLTARNEHAQQMMNDIDAFRIDPTRRWNSIGAGNQALASFAMILGGIGQGLGGGRGPNYAMQVIDKAIDQDIDAQKSELQKRETLLGKYLQQTGDMRASEAFTRADMYRLQQGQLDQAAAKMNSKVAVQQAALAGAKWELAAAQEDRNGAKFLIDAQQAKSQLGTAALQRDQLRQSMDLSKAAAGAAQQNAATMMELRNQLYEGRLQDPRLLQLLPEAERKEAVKLTNGAFAFASDAEGKRKIEDAQARVPEIKREVDNLRSFVAANPGGGWPYPFNSAKDFADSAAASLITGFKDLKGMGANFSPAEFKLIADQIGAYGARDTSAQTKTQILDMLDTRLDRAMADVQNAHVRRRNPSMTGKMYAPGQLPQ